MQRIECSPKDPTIKRIFQAVGSRKKSGIIIPADKVELSDTFWDGGSRSEYTAVDLTTFRSLGGPKFNPPQFGGPRTSPVVEIPPGVVIVEHGTFLGKPAMPKIHVRPDDLAKSLPAAAREAIKPMGALEFHHVDGTVTDIAGNKVEP